MDGSGEEGAVLMQFTSQIPGDAWEMAAHALRPSHHPHMWITQEEQVPVPQSSQKDSFAYFLNSTRFMSNLGNDSNKLKSDSGGN